MENNDQILAGILSSGQGSSVADIVSFAKSNSDKICVKALVSDNKDAEILKQAQEIDILSVITEYKGDLKRHEKAILDVLDALNIEWVFLDEYATELSNEFIEHYYDEELGQSKIINIGISVSKDFNSEVELEDAQIEELYMTACFVGVADKKEILQREIDLTKYKDDDEIRDQIIKIKSEIYKEVIKLIIADEIV